MYKLRKRHIMDKNCPVISKKEIIKFRQEANLNKIKCGKIYTGDAFKLAFIGCEQMKKDNFCLINQKQKILK